MHTTTVEEPQEQTWHATAGGGIDGKVIVGHAGIGAEDHLGSASVGIAALPGEQVGAREIEVAVMIAVGGRPWQAPPHHRLHDAVGVGSGVGAEAVLARDEVAVEHHQLRLFGIQHAVQHADRVDVLLRTPRVPCVCSRPGQPKDPDTESGWSATTQELSSLLFLTHSRRNAGPRTRQSGRYHPV